MKEKILLIIAILSGIGFSLYISYKSLHKPLLLETPIVFYIKKGEPINAVIRNLAKQHILSSNKYWVKNLIRLWYPNLIIQHGEYLLTPQMTLAQLLLHLREGKVMQRKFTIIEGYTVKRVKHLLMQTEGLHGDISLHIEEGMLYPDTYYYTAGQTRDDLLRVMHKRMVLLLDKLALTYNYDKRHLLILASIVEKETQVASERPKVAAVLLNRLKYNMKLQTDPTIIYHLSDGIGYINRPLSRRDLEVDSAYNSYKTYGLPPSAIAIPSLASLEAVLNPASTEDLYFVASILGGHCFSKELKTHNMNVLRYRTQATNGCVLD